MIKFVGDYNTQFSEEVNRLFDEELYNDEGDLLPHYYRIELANELTESFVTQTGERPPSAHLDRLSTYILKDKKKRMAGDKLPEPLEYPHLSDDQMKLRHLKEADWGYAEYRDVDGVNRSLPTKHNRIKTELASGKVKL